MELPNTLHHASLLVLLRRIITLPHEHHWETWPEPELNLREWGDERGGGEWN